MEQDKLFKAQLSIYEANMHQKTTHLLCQSAEQMCQNSFTNGIHVSCNSSYYLNRLSFFPSFSLSLSTEQVYHVTIPHQPSMVQSEAILKLSSQSSVTAIVPSTGMTLIDIPFEKIRRLGSLEAYSHDVIWFETCHNSSPGNFHFFTVPSGMEVAQQIIKDLKASIECYTSSLLIMEDCCDLELSFISREHYGCREFSPFTRNHLLQSGLRQLPPRWPPTMLHSQGSLRRGSDVTTPPFMRAMSCDLGSPAVAGVSLEEWAANKGRRNMSMSSSRGPPSLSRKPTLDQFRQNSTSSFDRSSNLDLSEGHFSDSIGSDVFEPMPRSNSPRKLSQQNSISSQSSSVSSHPPGSPANMENSSFVYEDGSPQARRVLSFTSHTAPVVPPRSVVSLRRQDASYIESVA